MNRVELSGLENAKHNPLVEELSDVLCSMTQRTEKGFYRPVIVFFLGLVASSMRATLLTKDRGELPINVYTMGFATSGFGKNYSVRIMEDSVLHLFRTRFTEDTFNVIANTKLDALAMQRASRNNSDFQTELDKLTKDFDSKGAYLFTFDSATVPALKQMREKLLLADAGSLNLRIDEVGARLIDSHDLLISFLELYDQGLISQKLIKNTNDNNRTEQLEGKTPTNMLLFGTPSKLFDGGKIEEAFYSLLEMGFARRCIYGSAHYSDKDSVTISPEQLYDRLTDPKNEAVLDRISRQIGHLADPMFIDWQIDVGRDVGIKLLEYKLNCEKVAASLPEHEETRKAEITHRYFKALKIAGVYAFMESSSEVTLDHLFQAILLVEDSGECFEKILKRDKSYVKLAKYISTVSGEVTHADLYEALPYYKQGNSARNEMMSLAKAWGYKNNIIIKTSYVDNIELFKGETLKPTDINKLIVSYSSDFAFNYKSDFAPFNQLSLLTKANGMQWCNHRFSEGHRNESNVIPGFNMIVFDIDEGKYLKPIQELLKKYSYLIYTTKRHTEEENRFRLILPINYELHLDKEEYEEFIESVLTWLPIPVDKAANQRCRKWTSHDDITILNEGELLDIIPFIPRTSKNDQFVKENSAISSMDSLERWFARGTSEGNRNNMQLRYALTLVDNGLPLDQVVTHVKSFNTKISDGLTEDELNATVFKTVAKRYNNKGESN